ncbi:MAG: Maf family protein [Bacillales bacterium]|jgi:septum formation protein|nr:Maf family protein [Bacillales bacterium]
MLILASQSPRRIQLLSLITKNFINIPSQNNEQYAEDLDYFEVPKVLATQKALEVFKNHPDDVVIGCDTVVITPEGIFGKPKDFIEATYMLNVLNNTEHYVVTGICILSKNKQVIYSEVSKVIFNNLSAQDIFDYIQKTNPYDKAGAYAIQEQPIPIIKEFSGEMNNIMGLPLTRLKKELMNIFSE